MKFSEIFKRDYYHRMLKPGHPANPVRNRADSFLKIFELLEGSGKECFNIVETGYMSKDHGEMCFGDDGASTFLWNEFLKYSFVLQPPQIFNKASSNKAYICDSSFSTVDICLDNVKYANEVIASQNYDHSAKAYNENSITFLNKYKKYNCDKIDLLYLDSFDITKDNPHPSQLHHLKELCAAMPHLNKGSIVVIDDHNPFFTNPPIGKGSYVKDFMMDIGANILFEDYQIGFML